AVDGLLDPGVEILHADAGAGDPSGAKAVVPIRRHIIGIDLDAELEIVVDDEGIPNLLRDKQQIAGCEHRGRSAPKMQLGDTASAVEARADSRDLDGDGLEVSGDGAIAQHLLGVAATEPAKPVAKGDMQVERNGRLCGEAGQPA